MITRYFVDHVTALICIVALMFEKCKMCEPLYVKPSKYGVIPSCNGILDFLRIFLCKQNFRNFDKIKDYMAIHPTPLLVNPLYGYRPERETSIRASVLPRAACWRNFRLIFDVNFRRRDFGFARTTKIRTGEDDCDIFCRYT